MKAENAQEEARELLELNQTKVSTNYQASIARWHIRINNELLPVWHSNWLKNRTTMDDKYHRTVGNRNRNAKCGT